LCERLLDEGHEVICLDNFDPYYDPNLKRENVGHLLGNPKFTLIEGDVRDMGIRDIIKEYSIEYVMHNAAQPGVRASIENPRKAHDVNTREH